MTAEDIYAFLPAAILAALIYIVVKLRKRNSKIPKKPAKDKKPAPWWAWALSAFVLVIMLGALFGDNKQATSHPHFSAWDGSHIELTKVIKSGMNNPSSYKHSDTRFKHEDDKTIVITEFFGENKFGATVRTVVTAYTDRQTGEVLEIISQN